MQCCVSFCHAWSLAHALAFPCPTLMEVLKSPTLATSVDKSSTLHSKQCILFLLILSDKPGLILSCVCSNLDCFWIISFLNLHLGWFQNPHDPWYVPPPHLNSRAAGAAGKACTAFLLRDDYSDWSLDWCSRACREAQVWINYMRFLLGMMKIFRN